MAERKYMQIFNEIRQQIFSGALVPQDMLPSENELAGKYAASRVTVRKSLNMLENQRLIRSWHGKGYFVNAPEHQRYTLIYEDLINKLESRLQSIKLIHPDPEISAALNLAPESWVVSIVRALRNAQRVLVCDQVFLPYQKGMPLVEAEIKYAEFPDLVKDKVSGFAVHTRMEIGNEPVSGEIATRLGIAEGTCLLTIHRFLLDEQERVAAYGKQYLHQNCGRIVACSGYSEHSSAL